VAALYSLVYDVTGGTTSYDLADETKRKTPTYIVSMSSNVRAPALDYLHSGGPLIANHCFTVMCIRPIYTYRLIMRRSNCRMLVGCCGYGSRNLSDPGTWCLVSVYRCPRYERGRVRMMPSDMFALGVVPRRVYASGQLQRAKESLGMVRRIRTHCDPKKILLL
jgi:hypothetical protein